MAEPTHRTTDEARAGTTPHVTRYVLAIGFVLAVIVLGLVVVRGMGTNAGPDVDTDRAAASSTNRATPGDGGDR